MQVVEVAGGVDSSAAANKKTVESMGAGPLLPVQGDIIGVIKKALMPFPKKMKQPPKHLLQSSTATVDDRIVLSLDDVGEDDNGKAKAELALDDNMDTAKVRGIPFVALCTYLIHILTPYLLFNPNHPMHRL